MKNNKLVKTTTNRGLFNRAHKIYLENRGKINCAYCPYHRKENNKSKYYGKYGYDLKIKFPNWKLVSKNSKQYMDKPIKIITKFGRQNRKYIEILF